MSDCHSNSISEEVSSCSSDSTGQIPEHNNNNMTTSSCVALSPDDSSSSGNNMKVVTATNLLNSPVTRQNSGSSNRSSVSSMASANGSITQVHHQTNLNQALALVTNKWDREQRKQDQEATRRLTLLRQRKISAVLKVDNLQKSLKTGGKLEGQLQQVRELEEEVANVDRELAVLGEEREQNSRRLNSKRVQHVTSLQQLGLLETLALSEEGSRWRSEADLKSEGGRKISPPLAILLSESRIRSGSDPSIAVSGISSSDKRKSSGGRSGFTTSLDESPKTSRRNPLRMLSNAIDFGRKKRAHRPKSADFERVNEDPTGGDQTDASLPSPNNIDPSRYEVAPPPPPPGRLLTPPPSLTLGLTNSRHSLPNLDPTDMEEALSRLNSSPYMTNPRKKRRPPPPHPLENRNSAPDIVVTGTGGHQRKHHLLEDRIHRAKARVQNSLYSLGGSSTSPKQQQQKLSTRFHTAQKINYKLAALSSFASVKRSRTFNISDVQNQLANVGNNNNSKTLPKQKSKVKLQECSSYNSLSGASSTASSRKSSNSSSTSSCSSSTNNRHEISQEALEEIAAFETFMDDFLQRRAENYDGNGNRKRSSGNSKQKQQQLKLNGHATAAAANGTKLASNEDT